MAAPGSERAALAALAWLWSAAYWPALALAQTAPRSASDAPVAFDIPAQSMASALNAWAVQANAQVFVDPGPVAHLKAPAVRGTLPPRQALRALLAHSNLQVTQGSGGVFVIKPRMALAAAPAPAREPQPAQPPPPLVAGTPEPLMARANGGPWQAGLSGADTFDHGSAASGAGLLLHGEYFITDHVSAALSLTTPRTHSFDLPGAGAVRASARLLSSSLGLKYYFLPEARLDPYVGAGIDLTALYEAAGVTGLDHFSAGPAAAAGLDLRLDAHWLLNADVSWAQVRPESGAAPGQEIHLDPVQFSLGFIYQF